MVEALSVVSFVFNESLLKDISACQWELFSLFHLKALSKRIPILLKVF